MNDSSATPAGIRALRIPAGLMELRSDRSVLPPDSNAMTRSFLKLVRPKATLLTPVVQIVHGHGRALREVTGMPGGDLRIFYTFDRTALRLQYAARRAATSEPISSKVVVGMKSKITPLASTPSATVPLNDIIQSPEIRPRMASSR